MALAVLLSSSISKAEQVVLSEIHYHPEAGLPEFIEIQNLTSTPHDMANWQFSEGIDFVFPDFDAANSADAYLAAREIILVTNTDAATLRGAYNIPAAVRVFGPYAGSLKNSGEQVTLTDKNEVILCSVEYGDETPWPIAADGTGHSLELVRPNNGAADYRNWQPSQQRGGTPGSPVAATIPTTPLTLDRVEWDSVSGQLTAVRLHHESQSVVSLANHGLATTKDFSDKVPISGSTDGNGKATITTAFAVGATDFTLYLLSPTDDVLDTVRLDAGSGAALWEAYPSGSGEWFTGGAAARQTDIVINEIMADLPSGESDGEFIELTNRGSSAIDLSGWQLEDAVRYTFASGTQIKPGGHLVIAGNAAWMQSAYSGLTVTGEYSGSLANRGERVRLIDANGNLADQVDYRHGGEWPYLSKGGGSSLELVHPDTDNAVGSAWAASDEAQKTTFTSYSYTAPYADFADERIGAEWAYKELHLHLVGDAHVALKNIQLTRNSSGSNLLTNGHQMTPNGSSGTGWLAQGTHWASHFSNGEMHLISDGHGDNRANRAEINATGMMGGDSLTLTFDARWISGKPTLIAQTFDHSFMKAFHLPVSNQLGTPGAPNSRLLTHASPALSELAHSPVVPSTSDDVTVSVHIDTPPAALASVDLIYREDNDTGDNPLQSLAMSHTGDGNWNATITDQGAQGRIVQFHVEATTTNGITATLPRGGATRPALYIVDNQNTDSDLIRYRWVLSEYDARSFHSGDGADYDYKFPRLSNNYKNMTLIVNESEVFYNCEIRPSGSPWHAADRGTLNKRGKWKIPSDKNFRNTTKWTFDIESSAIKHHNRIHRYWLYLLGHARNENEYAMLIENSDSPRFGDVIEPVGNDFVNRHWENGTDGELYHIANVFRFDDNFNHGVIQRRHWWYGGDAWPGPGRYHTGWTRRSREAEYDYSSLIGLFKLVDGSYTDEQIDRIVDAENIALMAAVRGYSGDWDSFTLDRSRNAFFYRRPDNGRFQLFHWDSDAAFRTDKGILDGGSEFFDWMNRPKNMRMFKHYLHELQENLTSFSPRLGAWFDAEDAASSEYSVNRSTYFNFFSSRASRVNNFLGADRSLGLSVDPVSATSAATVSLTGEVGYNAHRLEVAGHPEAQFEWTGETTWRIDGILLQQGSNALTINAYDYAGAPASGVSAVTVTVNKSNDAAPVIEIDTDPSSGRIAVTQTLTLDPTASHDPDGSALSHQWTAPTGLAAFTAGTNGIATASFSLPGLYDFNLQTTDATAQASTLTQQIAVHGPGGFIDFSDSTLPLPLQAEDVDQRDNALGETYYTLREEDGYLTLQVREDASLGALGHPWIHRPLPDEGDWVLETETRLDALQFGSFQAGLMAGIGTDRYALGYDGGGTIAALRISSGGTTTVLSQIPAPASRKEHLRIHREGGSLHFATRTNNVWTTFHSEAVPTASIADKGGVFANATSGTAVRASFDYLMLIDPGLASPLRETLIISEMHYNPLEGELLEWIELHNAGSTAIDLAGVSFVQGEPFDQLVLPAYSLAAGAYALVVHDPIAFENFHGASAAGQIVASWAGGKLSNGGETISLLDADGLAVLSFSYDDASPWPTAADGSGASLVINDTTGNLDPALGQNWHASASLGGTPGAAEASPFETWLTQNNATALDPYPGADLTHLVAYALAADFYTDPNLALPVLGATYAYSTPYATLDFTRRTDTGFEFRIEQSTDLVAWADATNVISQQVSPNPDGTEAVSITALTPLSAHTAVFYRLTVVE